MFYWKGTKTVVNPIHEPLTPIIKQLAYCNKVNREGIDKGHRMTFSVAILQSLLLQLGLQCP